MKSVLQPGLPNPSSIECLHVIKFSIHFSIVISKLLPACLQAYSSDKWKRALRLVFFGTFWVYACMGIGLLFNIGSLGIRQLGRSLRNSTLNAARWSTFFFQKRVCLKYRVVLLTRIWKSVWLHKCILKHMQSAMQS